MIRVLNVISDTNIGGAGRVILNYLRCADRTRFSTLAALPRSSLLAPELRELGAEVHEVDGLAERSWNLGDVRTLEALIREVKPDLVHTHGALSGRVAARRCGKPVIYTRHSVFPVPARLRYPPGRWLNRWLNTRYADHIIAVSPAARENLTDAGVPRERISVILNGVTPVPELPPGQVQALRTSLGLPPGDLVFGILARIEDYKGHLDLVEAVRQLRARGRGGFQLLIAGTGSFEETVKAAVRDAGVSDVVHLLGFRSDAAALLRVMDVQLSASYGTEATSLALLEGMSAGLCSVVSDYGGNPWVVRDGDNGLVFPTRDAAALSRCMERLMDEPETLLRLSRRAREVFFERFTAEQFAKNVERVYLETLKGAAHGFKEG